MEQLVLTVLLLAGIALAVYLILRYPTRALGVIFIGLPASFGIWQTWTLAGQLLR